jgi:CBS domain containing-hemolysin-like protein
MRQLPKWVLILILLLAILIIYFIIVGLKIPKAIASKLDYIIKWFRGVTP